MIDSTAIQLRAPLAADLATQVSQFLAAGGHIYESPPFEVQHKPLNFNNQAPNLRRAKKTRFAAGKQAAAEKKALAEKLRAMAKTMTQSEASAATGLSRRALYTIAEANGFTFRRAEPTVDRSRDAQDVERLQAYLKLGLSRSQATKALGFGHCKLIRLIDEYGIDYPKAKAFGR